MKFWVSLSAMLLLFSGCTLGPKPPQVTGAVRAPFDLNEVSLYLPQCEPAHYATVAKLDASKLGKFSSYQFNLNWIKKLRQQAAKLGANGLLLTPLSQPRAPVGPTHRTGPGFRVAAIYVPPVERTLAATANNCKICASKIEALLSAGPSGSALFVLGDAPHKSATHIKCSTKSSKVGIYP